METRQCEVRQACLVGARAQALLNRRDFSGTVLSVCSSVVYLLGTYNEVLWLAQEGSPAHRRCIQLSLQDHALEAGIGFSVLENCLRVGHTMIIDPGKAIVWAPCALELRSPLPLERANALFWKTLTMASHLPGPRGLGCALSVIHDRCDKISGTYLSENALFNQALPAIQELVEACRKRDMVRIAQSGLELVGLGPGLTPSGDDFIGALLFTAHHLRAAYPTVFIWDRGPILDLVHQACSLTNRISHAILSDLAQGHGPEPLHDFVYSLLHAQTIQRLQSCVNRLIGIGHTSGWDMLAGAMMAMLLTEPNR